MINLLMSQYWKSELILNTESQMEVILKLLTVSVFHFNMNITGQGGWPESRCQSQGQRFPWEADITEDCWIRPLRLGHCHQPVSPISGFAEKDMQCVGCGNPDGGSSGCAAKIHGTV